MENGIRIRNTIFEQLMNKNKSNRKHWEMLCSSEKPLVPFIGAGISAWCYPTWNKLLTTIVKENFPEDCADIVEKALNCTEQPDVKSTKDETKTFYWMEEIAECIFDHNTESYRENEKHFRLDDEELDTEANDPAPDSAKEPQKEEHVPDSAKEQKGELTPDSAKEPQKEEHVPDSAKEPQKEESVPDSTKAQTQAPIPDSGQAAVQDNAKTQEQTAAAPSPQTPEQTAKANMILRQLRENIGEESAQRKLKSVDALYKAFESTLLKEKKMPEYQKFFHRIFADILVTTNYDKALECCYPSLFSYSYIDLNQGSPKDDSWLMKVVKEKLARARSRLNGQDNKRNKISVPENPMLLKVHGSIEHADEIALTASSYEKVYNDKVTALLETIFKKSTLLFLGSGLRSDRYLDELKKCKKDSKIQHFAFLCISKDEEDEEKDTAESRIKKEEERAEELEQYGIYPIFYDENDLKDLIPDRDERKKLFHNYFLGLLLENLSRRKMYYPQPLELLWDRNRFEEKTLKEYLADANRDMLMQRPLQIVHRTEAKQIWKLLNSSDECPLIAVTGNTGSGRSALCRSIPELNRNYKDTMQFFYIPLAHCTRWDEFCLQLFEKMNIARMEIPKMENWRQAAQQVAERCGGYWRSVLILDRLDELKNKDNPELWDTIKKILWYWKEQQTRVIFTCIDYPEGISCYTWHIGELKNDDARMIFFSACTSKRYRNISFLEQKSLSELFTRQTFQPASAHLLGRYANSKNDLNSLLEEWKLYHQPGDEEQQILARMLGNHLLAEHEYDDQQDDARKEAIKRNILWVWGILDTYPGVFPSVFFENALKSDKPTDEQKLRKELTEKTLRYMKNTGLCTESCDEQKNILLKNMVLCVKKHFFEAQDPCGEKDTVTGGKFSSLYHEFEEELEKSEEKYSGLECFRGYTMDNYDGELRKYVLREYGRTEKDDEQPEEEILKLLDCLGRQVKDDQGRRTHKKLNLVLHYEIKLVARFLCNCLSRSGISEDKKLDIAKIGYRFAHYFHYIPFYTFPLAKQSLQIMESHAASQKQDKRQGTQGDWLCKLANLNRVMGDIQRMMGRKTEAAHYYKKALDWCDKQMLELFSGSPDTQDQNISNKCMRVRAGVLLISNDYESLTKMKEQKKDDPETIYESIGDNWGQAYYHQRMGEMLFDENQEKDNQDNDDNNPVLVKQRKDFDTIVEHYNQAAKYYMKAESKTGTAYILKSMGDLIEKFRTVYGEKDKALYTLPGNSDVCFQIENVKKDEDRHIWEIDAANCYRQAFIYYYGHINWRGFANVIQAMGTTYRISCGKNIKLPKMINVEKLYGLAEECYRWLGDVRGLADTLDYFGYGYRDCEDSNDNEYKHMALSKWMESWEIWKNQGNDLKANNINREIQNLRAELKPKAEG